MGNMRINGGHITDGAPIFTQQRRTVSPFAGSVVNSLRPSFMVPMATPPMKSMGSLSLLMAAPPLKTLL
jgi:hypothetical protein